VYRCSRCLELSSPGDPQYSLVLETREKTYTLYLVKTNSKSRKYTVLYHPPEVDPNTAVDDDDDNPRRRKSPRMKVLTKHGREIVKEIKICSKCLEATKGATNETTSAPIQ